MINSLFRRFIKILDLNCSSYLCPGVPTSFNYITMEIHLNRYKDSPCVFNFSFLSFDLPFVLRSSSWRLNMMVHQGFNSFSKCSLRFFSKELKHSSSRIPKCNSFSLHPLVSKYPQVSSFVLHILPGELCLCYIHFQFLRWFVQDFTSFIIISNYSLF